jgi:ABC-type phosphate transport system substrate-binding protein
VSEGTRPLNVDGVPLSRETVLSDRYPLSRSTFLSVYNLLAPEKDDKGAAIRRFIHFWDGDDEQSLEQKRADAIRRFVAYACSPEGQAILEAQGALRVY